jgi:hypothetical protein
MRRSWISRLAVVSSLLACSALALSVSTRTRGFSTFSPTTLPQRAIGDFDGDGRPDVARIQHTAGHSSIAVQFARSTVTVQLDSNIIALVEADVDHDGDLDLIGATPTGEILVWINDGIGDFTPQRTSSPPRISNTSLVKSRSIALAGSVRTIQFSPTRKTTRAIVVTRIRPPTITNASAASTVRLPSFRAPPFLHS